MRFFILCITIFITACTPRYAQVVSAHKPNYQQYVTQQATYEKALNAAQMESVAQKQDTHVPQLDIAMLWGRPAGFIGYGDTLIDGAARLRFNDALATTPLTSEAKWQTKNIQFVFYPNSELFQAYRSGGRCRDGVLIAYNGNEKDQLRALFCQIAPGSDWYVVR